MTQLQLLAELEISIHDLEEAMREMGIEGEWDEPESWIIPEQPAEKRPF